MIMRSLISLFHYMKEKIMKKNILVAFGDSYGAGAELFESGWKIGATQRKDDNKNFIQLLGKDYDECYNFSLIGASNPGFVSQLKKLEEIYNKNYNYTLVVMLTQHNRDFIYSPEKGWIDLYPGMSKTEESYKTEEENWYNLVNYPETAHLNWYKSINLVQNYCKDKSIKDVYIEQFNPSPFIEDLEFLIDRTKIYTTPVIKELFFKDGRESVGTLDWKSFLKTNSYKEFYSPNFHPNELGHKKISKKVKEIIYTLND